MPAENPTARIRELVRLRDWLRHRTPSDDPGLLALDWAIGRLRPEPLPTVAEVEGILDDDPHEVRDGEGYLLYRFGDLD